MFRNKNANFFLKFALLSEQTTLLIEKNGGGDLEMVVKEEMVMVPKEKLLKSTLPRRGARR